MKRNIVEDNLMILFARVTQPLSPRPGYMPVKDGDFTVVDGNSADGESKGLAASTFFALILCGQCGEGIDDLAVGSDLNKNPRRVHADAADLETLGKDAAETGGNSKLLDLQAGLFSFPSVTDAYLIEGYTVPVHLRPADGKLGAQDAAQTCLSHPAKVGIDKHKPHYQQQGGKRPSPEQVSFSLSHDHSGLVT